MRVLAFVVVTSGSCAPPPAAPRSTANSASTVVGWDYEIDVQPSLDLDVHATFVGSLGGALRIDDEAARFVTELELADGASWRKVVLGDARWSARCAPHCSVRYRFHLRDAAKVADDVDLALLAGGAVFAPPSSWLVRPSDSGDGRYRFRVTTPPRVVFSTGIRVAPAPAPLGTYEAEASSLDEATFAAFGALRVGHVADPGIECAMAPDLPLSDDVVEHWLRAEVGAISTYFAHPPDGHAMLFLAPGKAPATTGKTLGGGGASVVVGVGTDVTAQNVMDDWVVAHELVHVAFPDLDRRYTWFSEGLATYVEPIARERAGLVTRDKVWAEMIDGLPQGLPRDDDGGLDGGREWGRVYWGGALYFFVADVRIRERTSGKRGLEDALRAVIATGANVEAMMPLARILEIGDAATGTKVMSELYSELGPARGSVDLAALFRRLGVKLDGSTVRFDDAAPLAQARDAILPRARSSL